MLEEIGTKLVVQGLQSYLTGMGQAGSTTSSFGKAAASAQSPVAALSAKTVALGVAMGQMLYQAAIKAGKAIIDFGQDSIKAASDLNETTSKVGVVFGKQADKVLWFGESAAQALGMSKNAALAAAGTYGNLFRSMGMTEDKSADMSVSLVQLAADLASFNNIDPSEALDKLRAGLVGESEPLKSLGININEVILQEEALRLKLIKTKGPLDAKTKAQAAYSLIMKQSALAQGDFARTSTGLANQQRIFAANIENTKAALGTALLPVINKVMEALNKFFRSEMFGKLLYGAIDGIGKLLDYFSNLAAVIEDAGVGSSEFFEALTGPLGQGFQDFLSGMRSFFKPFTDGLSSMLSSVQSTLPMIQTTFQGMLKTVSDVWAQIGPVISTNVQGILTIIGGFLKTVGEWWEANGKTVMDAVKFVWDNLVVIIQSAIALISGIIKAGLQILSGDWAGAWETMKSTLSGIWDAIVSAVGAQWQEIYNTIVGWVDKIIGEVQRALSAWQAARVETSKGLGQTGDYGGSGTPEGARAAGGPIRAGLPYLVGENGPEIIVPNASGMVMPNSLVAGLAHLIQAPSTVYNNMTTNYNLGVTTSNSPAVVQRSFATMQLLAG